MSLISSLATSKTEEELLGKKVEKFSEEVNLQEFARILRLDEKEPTTQQLFRIHDRVCSLYKKENKLILLFQFYFLPDDVIFATCIFIFRMARER